MSPEGAAFESDLQVKTTRRIRIIIFFLAQAQVSKCLGRLGVQRWSVWTRLPRSLANEAEFLGTHAPWSPGRILTK